MATETVKSAAITNLDASPPVANTAGEGAAGYVKGITGSAAITSGVTATSKYLLCRVPTTAHVLSVQAWLDAAGTTITGDIGVYYSDSTTDGTAVANQGAAVSAALFGSAVALAAVVEPTEFSGENGTYVGSKRIEPLWKAAGLSSDPGGMFDIVFGTTATTGSAAVVNASVLFI